MFILWLNKYSALKNHRKGDKIEENKKSIAYSLYFEESERTLTEEEVTPVFEKVIDMVSKKHNAGVRNK